MFSRTLGLYGNVMRTKGLIVVFVGVVVLLLSFFGVYHVGWQSGSFDAKRKKITLVYEGGNRTNSMAPDQILVRVSTGKYIKIDMCNFFDDKIIGLSLVSEFGGTNDLSSIRAFKRPDGGILIAVVPLVKGGE